MEPLSQKAINPNLQKSLMLFAQAEKLRTANKFPEAVAAYQQAIQLSPMNGAAFRSLIAMLIDLREIKNAAKVAEFIPPALYRQSKELQNIHGVLLIEQEKFDQAIAVLKGLENVPGMDKFALYANLGTAFNRQEKFEEALEYYQKAHQINRNSPVIYLHIAGIYQKLENIRDAEKLYREALQKFPDDDEIPYEGSIFLLKTERFAEGFRKYAYRWKSINFGSKPAALPIPEWDGKGPAGRLLVVSEQGVGDQIVFSALLPALRKKVDKIAIALDARLGPLLKRSFPDIELLGEKLPFEFVKENFDTYIQAGDIGAVVSDIATWEKGWLAADRDKAAALREKYQRMFPGKHLIGLSWKSTRLVYGVRKSIDISTWKPVLDLRQCQFISLQYGDVAEDVRRAKEEFGVDLYVDPEIDCFNDLEGLAAQANALDLVITTSNSTAHLAAATNAPTWVILPKGSALLWYWGYKSQSRWYPHVRLFRTRDANDWTQTIDEVTRALSEKINENK